MAVGGGSAITAVLPETRPESSGFCLSRVYIRGSHSTSTPLLLSLPRSLFFLRRVGCRVRLLEHGVASPRSRGGSIRIRFDRLFPSIVKWRKWNNGDVKTNICIYICVMGNLECVYSLIKGLNKLISLYLCIRLFEREKCKLIRCFFEYYLIFFRFSEKRI